MEVNISCVIPHWPLTDKHDAMLARCVKSLKGSDETLVIVNDGIGFGAASNRGVSIASGNYVCIVNNDCEMFGDWDLTDLTDPDAVTFPIINGKKQEFSGAFLCIPKWVIDERGWYVYDERFEVGFWEDVDFWQWLIKEEIPFKQKDCGVIHPQPGFTMRNTPFDTETKNKIRYIEKWGHLPRKEWS